jgi:Glycosyl transferases group 1
MVILLDCRPVQYDSFNGEKFRFIIACTNILATQQGVEWWFLVDKSCPEDCLPGISAGRLISRKALPGKAGWKLWYAWQLPRVIKRYRPDLVITTGAASLSGTPIPQCRWAWEAIAPATDADGYAPPSLTRKETAKQDYAGGKEYFLSPVPATGPDLRVDLLKAFSLFKKRQKSNMQLVLYGKRQRPDDDFSRKLKTYKYRQDIHICDQLQEQEQPGLLGAAYGFIFLSAADSLGIPLLHAWKAGAAVIMTASGRLSEMAGDAVLYAQPGDPASLAGQLMALYKDEGLRNNLVAKGKIRAGTFNWERSAGQLWDAILGAIGQKPKINS